MPLRIRGHINYPSVPKPAAVAPVERKRIDPRGFTPEQDDMIRRLYQSHMAREIGDLMGKTQRQVHDRVRVLGLIKNENIRNGLRMRRWNRAA